VAEKGRFVILSTVRSDALALLLDPALIKIINGLLRKGGFLLAAESMGLVATREMVEIYKNIPSSILREIMSALASITRVFSRILVIGGALPRTPFRSSTGETQDDHCVYFRRAGHYYRWVIHGLSSSSI